MTKEIIDATKNSHKAGKSDDFCFVNIIENAKEEDVYAVREAIKIFCCKFLKRPFVWIQPDEKNLTNQEIALTYLPDYPGLQVKKLCS